MKKQTIALLSIIVLMMAINTLCVTSCKKSASRGSAVDSGTFYFHLHTNVDDTSIGGNPGPDSSSWVFLYDTQGYKVFLTKPQFFISNITLHNVTGALYAIPRAVLLKGLDSEDYYVAKVPIGTYDYATFSVGLGPAFATTPPTTLFVTDGNYAPQESSMWTGSGYNGMVIEGMFDTLMNDTAADPPASRVINFSFAIPNSKLAGSSLPAFLTNATITLPTRVSGTSFAPYVLTAGSTQYVHILCDYQKLLTHLDLKVSNTSSDANIDTLLNFVPSMFRYEQ